jgi:hypothetical protein
VPSNRGRAGAVLLCLLAVVLAGVLFPVTGLGTAPAGGPFEPPGADSGGAAPSGESSEPGRTAPTTADDPATDRPTATETTAEPTATPTETSAEAAATDDGSPSNAGGGLERLLAGVVVLAAVVVGGFAILTRRTGTGGTFGRGTVTARGGASLIGSARAAVAGAGSALTAVPRRTMRFVVGASGSVPRLLDAVGGAVGEVARGLRVALGGLGSSLGGAVVALPAGLFGRLSGLGGGLSGSGGLRSSLGGLFDDGTEFSEDRPADDARAATDVAPEESDEREPPSSVAEAWECMVETAPVRRSATKTPVEIARAAVTRGLPAEPVGRLTNLFRRVRYGDETDDDALASARESLAAIRDGDGGEGS